jgi:hypothetical protein
LTASIYTSYAGEQNRQPVTIFLNFGQSAGLLHASGLFELLASLYEQWRKLNADGWWMKTQCACLGFTNGVEAFHWIHWDGLVQIRFFSWPIRPAHEAITDLKRLGKTFDEGHGFSRAVKGLARLTAFQAAEKLGFVSGPD